MWALKNVGGTEGKIREIQVRDREVRWTTVQLDQVATIGERSTDNVETCDGVFLSFRI